MVLSVPSALAAATSASISPLVVAEVVSETLLDAVPLTVLEAVSLTALEAAGVSVAAAGVLAAPLDATGVFGAAQALTTAAIVRGKTKQRNVRWVKRIDPPQLKDTMKSLYRRMHQVALM